MSISAIAGGAGVAPLLLPPGVSQLSSITKLVLPILLLLGTNLPQAEAGPITYGVCVAGCEASINGNAAAASLLTANPWISAIAALAAWLGCPIACGPVLAAPSP